MIEPTTPKEECTLAMACHLLALTGYPTGGLGAFLGPLILWLMKKDQYPLVDDQGKEALNFNISMGIIMIASAILSFVTGGIACCFYPAILGVHLVFTIMAALKAKEGIAYRYPFNIRFIQ